MILNHKKRNFHIYYCLIKFNCYTMLAPFMVFTCFFLISTNIIKMKTRKERCDYLPKGAIPSPCAPNLSILTFNDNLDIRVIDMRLAAEKQLLTPKELSKLIGISAGTLAVWRTNKNPDIPYTKLGGKVMYHIDDINDWLQSNTRGKSNQR